jgi:hypothetical protein
LVRVGPAAVEEDFFMADTFHNSESVVGASKALHFPQESLVLDGRTEAPLVYYINPQGQTIILFGRRRIQALQALADSSSRSK